MKPTQRFLAKATDALACALKSERAGLHESYAGHMGRAQGYFDCARMMSSWLEFPDFHSWQMAQRRMMAKGRAA